MRFEQKRLSGKFRQMLLNTAQAIAMLAGLAACASQPSSDKATAIATPIAGIVPDGVAIVSTLAGGSEKEGFADGQGSDARFSSPHEIAIDAAGNLYVADWNNRRIRKVTPKGEVSTLAGGWYDFVGGQGNSAMFYHPQGIAIDAAGNLYVADSGEHCIRKITPKGKVSAFAGSLDKYGYGGFADGQGSAVRFRAPAGIVMDAAGNLYVTDSGNHRIRKITKRGEVTTLAGGGDHREPDFADGQGSDAWFNYPRGIAIDAVGNLYVADTWNHRIRKITPKGEVSTLAGGGSVGSKKTESDRFADGQGSDARFYAPHGIAIDASDNLYVTDRNNHRIRKVTKEGVVTTLAGGGTGFADGEGSTARFWGPTGIAIDAAGNLYVADEKNQLIRKIEIRRP